MLTEHELQGKRDKWKKAIARIKHFPNEHVVLKDILRVFAVDFSRKERVAGYSRITKKETNSQSGFV